MSVTFCCYNALGYVPSVCAILSSCPHAMWQQIPQIISNALAPRGYGFSLDGWFVVVFRHILLINIFNITYEIALMPMSQDLTDHKSTLVQVMAWCHQVTNHWMNKFWPRLCHWTIGVNLVSNNYRSCGVSSVQSRVRFCFLCDSHTKNHNDPQNRKEWVKNDPLPFL